MRNFHTVVLERMKARAESFSTEPYETGWASEAMFFVRVHEISGREARMDCRVQVSADGIEWIDEGTRFPTIAGKGSAFIKVGHFGGWLRLVNEVAGTDPRIKLTVHLVLKE